MIQSVGSALHDASPVTLLDHRSVSDFVTTLLRSDRVSYDGVVTRGMIQ